MFCSSCAFRCVSFVVDFLVVNGCLLFVFVWRRLLFVVLSLLLFLPRCLFSVDCVLCDVVSRGLFVVCCVLCDYCVLFVVWCSS